MSRDKTLYLDTEFSNFRGHLISLALVSACSAEWYEVLPPVRSMHPWVRENVMPVLGKPFILPREFKASLLAFLLDHAGAHIFADWPEDIGHLLSFLSEPDGKRLAADFTFHLITSGKLRPDTPHNALSDARALMIWHQGELERCG